MTNTVTIVKTRLPSRVCKRYELVDDVLEKHAVATILHADAIPKHAATADEMMAILREVTDSTDCALVCGQWKGGDQPFEVITEAELAKLAGSEIGKVEGGVHEIDGRRVAARLKRCFVASAWTLFDADNPAGMPDAWYSLPIQERFKLLEPILTGITDCERIEVRSSSARVSADGSFGIASHAYMRVNKGENGLSSTDYGQLTLATEITVKGVVKPLQDWLVDMKPGDKLRCEAPFRASESEAGVIFLMPNGKPCVYDVGTSTTHHLADAAMKADFDELLAEAKCLMAEDTDAISEVASMAGKLKPVPRDTVFKTLKAATGVSLTVLRQQARTADNDDRGGDDQLALARRTIETIGSENIIFADAVFWMWDGTKGVWVRCDDKAVKQIAQGVVVDAGQEVTSGLINGVTEVLSNAIYADGHEFNLGNPETVNCPNGELELSGGKWLLMKHRRELFRTTQIPVAYDANADAPLFRAFLGQVFRDDDDRDDKVQAVLELMGYTLMSHARHELFVMLIGSGANGKSVLLAVLEALCGSANTAGVQPSNFDRSFQRAHLHMKLANIVTEINQGVVMADAELKGIVSGEASTVENKFETPFTMRPFATCWFGTNHMPHTRDHSNAIFRRAMIVTFNRTFAKDEQDPQLKDKLMVELPGILNLCLAAYAQALVLGFTHPASSEAAKNEWRLETDQVAQFVEDACTRDAACSEKSSAVYAHYKSWVDLNGIKHPVTHKTLRDRLTLLGFGKKKTREGNWVTGLKLNASFYATDA
jgi:putative DNA primase/helicase